MRIRIKTGFLGFFEGLNVPSFIKKLDLLEKRTDKFYRRMKKSIGKNIDKSELFSLSVEVEDVIIRLESLKKFLDKCCK